MQHLVCYSTTFCPLFVAISEEQCTSRFNICFLRKELGEVYNSYKNSEKEKEVCRPSRVDGIHDGFDKKKQTVKMPDVYGIEKVWRGIHSNCTEHGDFETLRSI